MCANCVKLLKVIYMLNCKLNWFICSFISVIFFTISIGVAFYGAIAISDNSKIVEIKCKDANCTVNIINGICFAKILDLPDSVEPKRVDCDKKRKGTYNITLPCDVEKNGNPKINCNKENKNISTGLILLMLFIAIAGFNCFISCFICVVLSFYFFNKIFINETEKTQIKQQIKNIKQSERNHNIDDAYSSTISTVDATVSETPHDDI